MRAGGRKDAPGWGQPHTFTVLEAPQLGGLGMTTTLVVGGSTGGAGAPLGAPGAVSWPLSLPCVRALAALAALHGYHPCAPTRLV